MNRRVVADWSLVVVAECERPEDVTVGCAAALLRAAEGVQKLPAFAAMDTVQRPSPAGETSQSKQPAALFNVSYAH